jgi:hypothetical protein
MWIFDGKERRRSGPHPRRHHPRPRPHLRPSVHDRSNVTRNVSLIEPL